MSMVSGKEFVTQVIEVYRELPCLWKSSDPSYQDKNKRNEALNKLLELFREQDTAATKDVVLKKIQSMRGAFRKELNKVNASERSGASTDDIHVPKLWYFNLTLSLEDQELPRPSCSAHSILDKMPFGGEEDSQDDGSQDDNSPASSHASTPRLSQGSFKRPRSKADQVLEKVAKKMDEPPKQPAAEPPKKQHDAFGEHVAEKLRYLSPNMVPLCQKLINDVIFYAVVNALNFTSRIVTDEPQTFTTPTTINPITPANPLIVFLLTL